MTPAVELLQASPGRVAALGSALRPNAAMVYRIRDIRGDSPLKNHRYQELYARLAASDPVYFQPIQTWQGPILDDLGVRWVVAAPRRGSSRSLVESRLPGRRCPCFRTEIGASIGALEPREARFRALGLHAPSWRLVHFLEL